MLHAILLVLTCAVYKRGKSHRPQKKRLVFRSTRCYERYLELLAMLPGRFGVRLHGYVLVPNHYHLQVEPPEANLSRAFIGSMSAIAFG